MRTTARVAAISAWVVARRLSRRCSSEIAPWNDAERTECRKTIVRPLQGPVGVEARRAARRDEDIPHLEIRAPRAAKARDAPCVVKQDLRGIEYHHAILRYTFRAHLRLAVIADDHGAAHDGLRIARSGTPLPAPA